MRLNEPRWILGAATLSALAVLAACAPWPMAALNEHAGGSAPIAIDQARALAGSITRADAPGFPVTLASPGHYRLASDLVVPADGPGIVIAAKGITLDLNGFTLRGPAQCARPQSSNAPCSVPMSDIAHGVHVQAFARGAVVRNGSVRGFAGMGVLMDTEGQLDHLEVADNAGTGVHANTSAARPVEIHHVSAIRNGGDGFWLQTGTITHARALYNGRAGFALGALMRWDASSASGNAGVHGDLLPTSEATAAMGSASQRRNTSARTNKPAATAA